MKLRRIRIGKKVLSRTNNNNSFSSCYSTCYSCLFSSSSLRYFSTTSNNKDEEVTENNIREQQEEIEERYRQLEDFKKSNIDYYPSYKKTLDPIANSKHLSLNEFVQAYSHLPSAARERDSQVTIKGRISSVRKASKKLIFYDISCVDHTNATLYPHVQVMATAQEFNTNSPQSNNNNEFDLLRSNLRRGDVILATGFPAKTKMGELSLVPTHLQLYSPCVRSLPAEDTLLHPETRHRRRTLDFLLNEKSKTTFLIRCKAIQFLRKFFVDRNFLEVETPILSYVAGGANAKPFQTFHDSLNTNLYLRIAPELYLKQLVVSGFERVFEIGKNFRNEAMDPTHSPEFTSCEFYCSWEDFEGLMKLTEDLLSQMVKHLRTEVGGELWKHIQENCNVNFEGTPYKRVSIIQELEKCLGQDKKIPLPKNTEEESKAEEWLLREIGNLKLTFEEGEPRNYAKMMDKLVGKFIEPMCIDSEVPVFIYDFPIAMSPLAKESKDKKGVAERFELIVRGKELCNAYTELNEAKEQRERFERQREVKKKFGEQAEAQMGDEAFCESLEYGLPPTAGWGIGLDRLCMILSGSKNIRDVQSFSLLRK